MPDKQLAKYPVVLCAESRYQPVSIPIQIPATRLSETGSRLGTRKRLLACSPQSSPHFASIELVLNVSWNV